MDKFKKILDSCLYQHECEAKCYCKRCKFNFNFRNLRKLTLFSNVSNKHN